MAPKIRIVAMGCLMVSSVSLAQSSQTAPSPVQTKSYVTVANSSADLAQYQVPAGPQYSGVAYLFIQRSDLPDGQGDVCTGALINGGHSVLTAAHCLADGNGQVAATNVDIRFTNTGGGPYTTATAKDFRVNEQYTGNVIDSHDVAVINLDAPVTGFTSYNLYGGDAVGQTYDVVGWGNRGTGDTGDDPSQIFEPRHGFNQFDFATSDPIFGDYWNNQDVYMSDFDSGNPQNDGSCYITSFFVVDNSQYCGLGLGSNEVNTGPGDSGGPEFVNVNGEYQIAGITSFGTTFGFDPSFGGPDIDNALNSTYGELAGYARVDVNRDWILSNTPEPTSVALLGMGLAGLIPMARRRKKV